MYQFYQNIKRNYKILNEVIIMLNMYQEKAKAIKRAKEKNMQSENEPAESKPSLFQRKKQELLGGNPNGSYCYSINAETKPNGKW
jgi:hypothetical protein